MKCTNCHEELQEGQKFCHSCGQAVNTACPNCGEIIEGTPQFCSACGYSLKTQESAPIAVSGPVGGTEMKYPPEEAIKKLMEMNSEAKAAIFATIGTRFLNKWLAPILRDGEKLVTVDNIQSKWLLARYRHECVVLTDQRVIKMEKLQYFKPKIEECELRDIQSIEVDHPANAVSATVIGEKVKIVSSSGTMSMRMVGKGYAQKLKARIQNIQNETGVVVSSGNKKEAAGLGRKKRRINWIGWGAVVVLLVIFGSAYMENRADKVEAENILKVQNGYLGDYGAVTMGTVFAEMLPNGKWNGFSTDKEQVIVQYTTKDEDTKIQFMISEDGSYFNVVHMVFKGEILQEASDCKIVLDSLYGEYFSAHPELGQAENPSWDNVTTEGRFTPPVVSAAGGKAIQTKDEASDADISTLLAASGEEVAAFLKEAGIPEDVEGVLYGDDDIVLSLDNDGKLAAASIMSEKYSWYGMRVGEQFPAERAENVFETYGYGLFMSYEGEYFYAVNSERAQSSDGTMRIMLYDDQSIMEIDYISSGAAEAWSSLASGKFEIMDTPVETTPAYDPYILPDSDTRYLSGDELAYWDQATLRLARNEIYARHGRQFKSEDLNAYFNAQPWYDGYIPADAFDDSVLNEYEKANLDLIKSIENGM